MKGVSRIFSVDQFINPTPLLDILSLMDKHQTLICFPRLLDYYFLFCSNIIFVILSCFILFFAIYTCACIKQVKYTIYGIALRNLESLVYFDILIFKLCFFDIHKTAHLPIVKNTPVCTLQPSCVAYNAQNLHLRILRFYFLRKRGKQTLLIKYLINLLIPTQLYLSVFNLKNRKEIQICMYLLDLFQVKNR